MLLLMMLQLTFETLRTCRDVFTTIQTTMLLKSASTHHTHHYTAPSFKALKLVAAFRRPFTLHHSFSFHHSRFPPLPPSPLSPCRTSLQSMLRVKRCGTLSLLRIQAKSLGFGDDVEKSESSPTCGNWGLDGGSGGGGICTGAPDRADINLWFWNY